MDRIVCFGEMMLRLSAPDGELMLQTPRLIPSFAGTEGNVAVSLARLGRDVRYVTVLPDNALGRAAFDALRGHGVDLRHTRFGEGRMGLFWVTPGAVVRPAEVLYDRADSAFARAADQVDWGAALEGAAWLLVSGVTPALGPVGTAGALKAVESAVRLGVRVAFDGNYRGKLWGMWDGDAPGTLRRMLEAADLAFMDDRDVHTLLGRSFEQTDADARRRAAVEAAFEAFPRLKHVAHTVREIHGVDHQSLSAVLHTREGETRAGPVDLSGIVDRIGGGDAFAAGLLHTLCDGGDPEEALGFALAATALKHGIAYDFNLSSEADVRALMAGGGLDVRR